MLSLIRLPRYHFLVVVSVIILMFALAGAASAHGVEVVRSDPADGALLAQSPAQVQVWFSEELASGESKLQVMNSAGTQVDNGNGGVDLDDPDHASMKVTLPALPDGIYLVKWHAVLTDGDASDEQFSFTVGQALSSASSYPPPGGSDPIASSSSSYPAPGSSLKAEPTGQKILAPSGYPPPGAVAADLAAKAAPETAAKTASQSNRWLLPAIIGAGLLLLIAGGLSVFFLRRLKQPGV
jgi:methionine-rich copper-binding protein CopC